MKHLDLFSGIGGFALAVDRVWPNSEHIFCDNDEFCQQVLKKHWPNSKIYGDIRELRNEPADLVTGGFPCQPFSVAGKQRGAADDRFLWPEMLRVIKESKPTWVIGENVAGIVNMALEQVCVDLEAEGYEVWPIIIPACAVNAPHRRDRVWIVGYAEHNGRDGSQDRQGNRKGADSHPARPDEVKQPTRPDLSGSVAPDTRRSSKRGTEKSEWSSSDASGCDWSRDWFEIAAEAHRMDDGLPNRVHRIKALGNSIVPKVAIEIMKAMLKDKEEMK